LSYGRILLIFIKISLFALFLYSSRLAKT